MITANVRPFDFLKLLVVASYVPNNLANGTTELPNPINIIHVNVCVDVCMFVIQSSPDTTD